LATRAVRREENVSLDAPQLFSQMFAILVMKTFLSWCTFTEKLMQRRQSVGLVWKFPCLGKHGAGGEEAVRVALKEKLTSAPLYKQRWAPRQDHLQAKLLYKSLIAGHQHWKKIWEDSLFIHEVWFADIFNETNIFGDVTLSNILFKKLI
jgi:hypothetical protein